MKINIYGVGRSGTKAVQLYIAQHMARKEGEIWLNYEPYFHCTRKMERSYRGLLQNLRNPHILAKDEKFSSSHRRFIQGLSNHKLSTVTKFIRANGRIEQIDEVMQPDHTFVIVRDLYQTLASLFANNWDYYRYGYSYYPLTSITFLKAIIADAVRLNLIPDQYEIYVKYPNELNRIGANAFCWYVMNKYILSVKRDNLHFIDYSKIEELPNYLSNLLPDYFSGKEKINHPKYKGEHIHTDILLQSKNNTLRRYLNILNEIPFYILARATHFSPVIANRKTGESVSTVVEPKLDLISEKWEAQKLKIQHSELLDSMNEEINNLLRIRLNQQLQNNSISS